MKLNPKEFFHLVKQAATDWMDDHAPRLGASLAFYTIFSLAPLITLVVSLASLWFTNNAGHEIYSQLGSIIGADNAQSLQQMLSQPGKEKSGIIATVSSAVMLIFGATGVFVQLQDALNQIWEVKAKPGQGIMGFVRHRLLSFAAVLGIGFLLLVSLLLTAGIAAMGKFLSGWLGDAEWLWQVINLVVSFGIVALLFAFMFKYMPDAEIGWRDVWFGAFVTSALFSVGKFVLGIYLAKNSLASTYSAAGALIVVLLWVYYSAQIVFFGAEITQAYATFKGRTIQPSPHAEWDEAKISSTKAEAEYRERKKSKKEEKKQQKLHPAPVPAFAMGGPAQAEKSEGSSPRSLKALGGLMVLALLLVPFEKKSSRRVGKE